MAETARGRDLFRCQGNNNGRQRLSRSLGSQAITFDLGLPWDRGDDGEQREIKMNLQLRGDSQILVSVQPYRSGIAHSPNADSNIDVFLLN